MKIAVVSDLHITSEPKAPATRIRTFDPQESPTTNHLTGLKALIAREAITADILLCPGDIADKADPASLKFGWAALNELARNLGARSLIATAGNHDMDSRYIHNKFDAKGMLQTLRPPFPGLSEELCDRFWSRNFAVVEGDFWRIVVLNSSAFHGAGLAGANESEHGRVSPYTVSALQESLSALQNKPLNILLCHHHIYRDNTLSVEDYSEMAGADTLLRTLDCGDFGNWLVIHGHKHHPKLAYSVGGAGSSVIFSAGSLSAELYPALIGHARNQFYCLDLPVDHVKELGLDIGGRITAWDWIPMRGWFPAGSQSGLPHYAGFGSRLPITGLAATLASAASSQGAYLTWTELLALAPELLYRLPHDIERLCHVLKSEHNVSSVFGSDGSLRQIGKGSL